MSSSRLLHISHELKVLYKLVDDKPVKVAEICKGYILSNELIDDNTKFYYFSNIKDVNTLLEVPLYLVDEINKQWKIQKQYAQNTYLANSVLEISKTTNFT